MRSFLIIMTVASVLWAHKVFGEISGNEIKREPSALLNQYYTIKKSDPPAAKKVLHALLRQYPNNTTGLAEMGYWYLNQKQPEQALPYLQKAFQLDKKNMQLALQMAYILGNTDHKDLALHYFDQASASTDLDIRQKALAGIDHLKLPVPQASLSYVEKNTTPQTLKKNLSVVIPKPKPTTSTSLLNKYYALKKTHPAQAEAALNQLLQLDPNNIVGLKTRGYQELADKNFRAAYCDLKKAYYLTRDPKLAAQLAYLLNQTGHNHEAYYYFNRATQTQDQEARQQYNQALTNLAGWQTKVLKPPYVADIYASPLYYSRFDLAILPFVARTGVYLGNDKQVEVYTSLRATKDDRSTGGVSPQVYEDNVAVLAVGARYQPLSQIPLYFWAEFGRGYDLIDRNRSRWRGDARGGAFYQNVWGIKPTYVDKLSFPLRFTNEAYGEATYYTRYQNNLIATWRMRPGIRVAEFKSAYLDAYVDNQIIGDTNHEYYNNYFEWGPGVVLVPFNRYNFDIRYEFLHGYYIKVNSPTPNPYGSRYNNQIIMAELYTRF